jgi:hypothetical protein
MSVVALKGYDFSRAITPTHPNLKNRLRGEAAFNPRF